MTTRLQVNRGGGDPKQHVFVIRDMLRKIEDLDLSQQIRLWATRPTDKMVTTSRRR